MCLGVPSDRWNGVLLVVPGFQLVIKGDRTFLLEPPDCETLPTEIRQTTSLAFMSFKSLLKTFFYRKIVYEYLIYCWVLSFNSFTFFPLFVPPVFCHPFVFILFLSTVLFLESTL